MNKLVITDLKKENIDDVLKIEKTSVFSNWTQQMFYDSYLNENHFFKIGIYDGKIVGYIIYSVVLDEAEILNIVVDSCYRGNSFGKQMLTYALENIKNQKCSVVFLEVAKKNVVAENLYSKFDFIEYNIRRNYYKNDDAVLMKKIL